MTEEIDREYLQYINACNDSTDTFKIVEEETSFFIHAWIH